MPDAFLVGDAVRYKPGHGTYGYEEWLDADGRVAGEVIGFSPQRVRVRFTMTTAGGRARRTVTRSVEAENLIRATPPQA